MEGRWLELGLRPAFYGPEIIKFDRKFRFSWMSKVKLPVKIFYIFLVRPPGPLNSPNLGSVLLGDSRTMLRHFEVTDRYRDHQSLVQ